MAPSKKKSLSEVANATAAAPMKLRSPGSRKPTKIHTPEPAPKRVGLAKELNQKKKPPKPPSNQPPAKPPSNKPPTTTVTKPSTALQTPTETTIHSTPKKKSIQLQIRRSPRNSSKLTVHKPALNTETETTTVPPSTSKYPTRTLSSNSSHERSIATDLYPSLTPSPEVSDEDDDAEEVNHADKEDDFAYEMAEDNVADKDNVVAEDGVVPEVSSGADKDKEAEGVEFSNENNAEADNTEERDDEEPAEELLSIRCKTSSSTDSSDDQPGKKRKRRGVVCGTKLADLVYRLGSRIKAECSFEANGPVSDKIRSMMTHQIGSCVREKVSMLAPTYSELDLKHWNIVTNYLSPQFFLPEDDTMLWEYITRQANSHFKDWKSNCRTHYLTHGEKTPKEFKHREEEWKWLVQHFQEPAQQAISARMKDARKKKMNHHSGKTPFTIRVVKHMEKGHKAPHVAAFEEVYSQEPESLPLVEQMNCAVNMLTHDQDHDDSDDPSIVLQHEPLPTKIQLDIIYKAVGQKRGTVVSRAGGTLKRPLRPRGGASNHALKEELTKAKEEAAKKDAEFECRLRALEDMLKLGASGHDGNVSDGASFGFGSL